MLTETAQGRNAGMQNPTNFFSFSITQGSNAGKVHHRFPHRPSSSEGAPLLKKASFPALRCLL